MFLLFGFLSWFLLEYVMHRFVLHNYSENHTEHHNNPHDSSDPFIPIKTIATVSFIYCGLLFLFLSGYTVFMMYFGLVLGYIWYEYVHYTVHYGTCNNWLLRYLKKSHAKHHFVDSTRHYSVTLPVLDKVFGTD